MNQEIKDAIIVLLDEVGDGWHYEDRGYDLNCCYSCGAEIRSFQDMKHKDKCRLKMAIDLLSKESEN